ncbi:MAG: GNAT family N-acetyltransferase [Leptolyngbya foveolarum]|uniref:GNAT family N-acetyltransferase n=1 Tax=Leptolyngbya foveolarum TaxID=47253 RepID=A0A2W4WIS0_9CYAN|nr:MAG: GNAT family N-acetyltransferase [Leptolyngbya foveolarum]
MEIKYSHSTDNVDWGQVSNLFRTVSWSHRDPDALRRAFSRSTHVRFALCKEKIVACGRTIDDGEFYAMVVDLVVSPEFQGEGIGRKILCELKDASESFIFTTLISAVGKEPFYQKQGWLKQKTGFIWPRSEQQSADHAICD